MAKLLKRTIERADYLCEYTSQSGIRCNARHDLEVHHSTPFAICKSHSEANLSLLCRAHNAYEACQDFGAEFMRSKVSGKQKSKTGATGEVLSG